jgi:hypothetical protein
MENLSFYLPHNNVPVMAQVLTGYKNSPSKPKIYPFKGYNFHVLCAIKQNNVYNGFQKYDIGIVINVFKYVLLPFSEHLDDGFAVSTAHWYQPNRKHSVITQKTNRVYQSPPQKCCI